MSHDRRQSVTNLDEIIVNPNPDDPDDFQSGDLDEKPDMELKSTEFNQKQSILKKEKKDFQDDKEEETHVGFAEDYLGLDRFLTIDESIPTTTSAKVPKSSSKFWKRVGDGFKDAFKSAEGIFMHGVKSVPISSKHAKEASPGISDTENPSWGGITPLSRTRTSSESRQNLTSSRQLLKQLSHIQKLLITRHMPNFNRIYEKRRRLFVSGKYEAERVALSEKITEGFRRLFLKSKENSTENERSVSAASRLVYFNLTSKTEQKMTKLLIKYWRLLEEFLDVQEKKISQRYRFSKEPDEIGLNDSFMKRLFPSSARLQEDEDNVYFIMSGLTTNNDGTSSSNTPGTPHSSSSGSSTPIGSSVVAPSTPPFQYSLPPRKSTLSTSSNSSRVLKKRPATPLEEMRIVRQMVIVLLRELRRLLVILHDGSTEFIVTEKFYPGSQHTPTDILLQYILTESYSRLLYLIGDFGGAKGDPIGNSHTGGSGSFSERRGTQSIWMGGLQDVLTEPVKLGCGVQTEKNTTSVPNHVFKMIRHEFDSRYDLNLGDSCIGGEIIRGFGELFGVIGSENSFNSDLNRNEDEDEKEDAPSKILDVPPIWRTEHTWENRSFQCNPAKKSDLDAVLTATYPWIKKTGQTAICPDTKSKAFTLLNDPNADAFFVAQGDGYVIGAVADGSGSGEGARFASNIAVACLCERVCGKKWAFSNDKVLLVDNGRETELKSTTDMIEYLHETLKYAQACLAETEKAGGTTVVYYCLTEVSKAEAASISRTTPGVFGWYDSSGNDNENSHMMALTYVIAGDTEALWYDSQRGSWKSLEQRPFDSDGIRLNTSVTPGGIGKHRGTNSRIWGAWVWPEYIRREKLCENGETPTPNTDVKDPFLGIPITQDPMIMQDFYRHSNNIHYGQLLLHPSDFLIFTTDGLGDTLDPIQLYPRPGLIKGLDCGAMGNGMAWQTVAGQRGSAWIVRRLKEMQLQKSMEDLLENGIDGSYATEKNENNPNISHDHIENLSANSILEACIKHANNATVGTRNMYRSRDFLKAKRPQKLHMIQESIEDFIWENFPKFMRKIEELNSVKITSSKFTDGKLGLPEKFVPFAKVDHLGIQVLRAGIACRAQKS